MTSKGLRIVSFESRRRHEISDLIQQSGADAMVAPAMQEVPLSENHEALAFGNKLLHGQIDLMVFTTGVGAAALWEILGKLYASDKILQAFSRIFVIARGPKSVEALRQRGLTHALA